MDIFVRYQIIFFNISLIFYFHLKLEKSGEVYEKFVLKAHLSAKFVSNIYSKS